ncbi:hypothetical protein SDC9_137980 [bioreactor metagenome]|uniref:Uncharacterized protein n=1 Tax=bioreactor metagenome TaxID=1076179 RepID=A0A645DNI9_9ZZZZ
MEGLTLQARNMSQYLKGTQIERIDYDTTLVIFDSLSCAEKNKFIERNKKKIKSNILFYIEKYPTINNIDSLFNILVSCRIDSLENKEILSFKVFLIIHIVEKKNLDGYVGEFVADMYYNLFINHPGYFYQYLDFLDKKNKGYIKKSILTDVANGCDFNYIDEVTLKKIFDSHRLKLSNKKKQIKTVETFLKHNL